jgi:ATP-dependent RNA helicase DDX51/DBP6
MARGMEAGGEGEQVRYATSYDAPRHLDTYVHRAGRTARAGKAGTAITLLEKKEVRTAPNCYMPGLDINLLNH